MKTGPRISVLLLGTTAVALTLAFAWFWTHRRQSGVTNVPAGEQTNPIVSTSAEVAPEATPEALPLAQIDGELPPVIPVSLASLFTTEENDQWDKSKVFKVMPRGSHTLGGVEFLLEGMVQLQSKSSKDEKRTYRERIVVPLALTNVLEKGVEVVQRGSNVGSVYLLGATRYGGEGEQGVADLVWRYADGSSRRSPIRFDNQVRDWIRAPYELPTYLPYAFSKVVWRTPSPNMPDRTVRLYRFAYNNPQPTKLVQQLELISAMEEPNLFVVGLTLDPLKLGQRPDDSPNLEDIDAPLDGRLQLIVQSSEGQPIANAKVRTQCYYKPVEGKSTTFTRPQTTDVSGVSDVGYMTTQVEKLEVSVSHDDYSARKMVWDAKAGDIIPASYVLKLTKGVTFGGIVVEGNDSPVAGVKIRISRFWMGNDEMNRKGEQADVRSMTKTTDAEGRWEAKGLPADLMDRLHLSFSHPDFVNATLSMTSGSGDEKKLRDGTHRMVLKRGLIVRGKVIDDQNVPIADARVWAGKANYSGTQDTKTDAQGTFTFRNVTEGELQFSVMAKGRKPEVKDVTVKYEMEELVFKLGPGQVVRGLVKNESGEPVPDVRVALEADSGGVSQDYQVELKTDAQGRFEWDSAPDEARKFCFLKTGYEAKRRQLLKLNEENVITLRKGRKIQGWVLDAETEKPITKFRVGIGRSYGTDQFYADYPGMKDLSDPNGQFALDASEEEQTAIKAEADDYAAKVEKLPEAQNGAVQVVIHLKPSASVRGVVVDMQGAPVAGASVAFTSGQGPGSGMNVTLRNGRLQSYGQAKIVTTGSSGEFVLSSPPESGMVVAAAEAGLGIVAIQQVRDTGRVVLQGFGSIDGTFKVGGQPVAGQEFTYSLSKVGLSLDFSYKATTDEAGHFMMGKLPAGEGQIVRLVKTSANSWTHSHMTEVMIEPGKTTQITLGDSGAVLKGHVSFETPPAADEKVTISGRLSTQGPTAPSFNNPEEARAFFESSEWKEAVKKTKHFGVSVNADGTLALDSIPPGTYNLNVTASKTGKNPWENPPIAQGNMKVVVPENATPYTPIVLDDIVLKPTKPSPSSSAFGK